MQLPCFHILRLRSWRVRLSLLLWVICLAGCSGSDQPELGQVRGQITLDGKPLAGASVRFAPMGEARGSRGLTDEQGNYELAYLRDIQGAALGKHKVTITTATEDQPAERLPARYNTASTLSVDVAPGNNIHDFALTSK